MLFSPADTIVAVASPPGAAARAVLRVSGSRAIENVGELASGVELGRVRGFSGAPGRLRAGGLEVAAWIAVYRAPRSYTGEDLIEVHVPSSPAVTAAISRALVVRDGVRWAAPGEFTLRAFLNGRMDLSRAEAVEQLISAADERDARAARRALGGELALRIREISSKITEAVALLEAALDFPDEDVPEIAPDRVLERLRDVERHVARLRGSTALRLAPRGALVVVLAGFPNAGKSSLLNAILGHRAALVSSLAGTTRDPVRGTTDIRGTKVEWVDLAGAVSLDAEGSIFGLEAQLTDAARGALRRLTRVEMEHADLVLWVLDPTSDDAGASVDAYRAVAARKLLVVNKLDLLRDGADDALWGTDGGAGIGVSAKTGEGIEELVLRAVDAARRSGVERPETAGAEARFLVSAHQEAALLRCAGAVGRAVTALETLIGYEYAAADLREALDALEELTGRVTSDDILGHVFSRFCIGK